MLNASYLKLSVVHAPSYKQSGGILKYKYSVLARCINPRLDLPASKMKFHSIAFTLAAAAEAVSAAQLLICSDSTTANYALDDTLQG